MEYVTHTMNNLFAQLGKPSDDADWADVADNLNARLHGGH